MRFLKYFKKPIRTPPQPQEVKYGECPHYRGFLRTRPSDTFPYGSMFSDGIRGSVVENSYRAGKYLVKRRNNALLVMGAKSFERSKAV